jgi:methyl-accepting chemotaxis protein
VKEAAGHTAQASGSVSEAANDLAQQAEGLKSAVQTFLREVRAA